MTLAIAWVRNLKGSKELVFASDSRLNGGVRWDQCPKMLTLPRSDCAICFAGTTHYTYPLIVQLSFAVSSYNRSQQRAMDLFELKGHIKRIFNSLQDAIYFNQSSYIKREDELKDAEFIFGGYSWREKRFAFWRVKYNTGKRAFEFEAPKLIGNYGVIAFAGDWLAEGRNRLVANLIKKNGKKYFSDETNPGFDMEPFEALSELLHDNRKDMNCTIGGPPQVIKVYEHMNCRPVGVYWSTSDKVTRTLLGRTLLDYEDCDCWFLDPLNIAPPQNETSEIKK